MHVESPSACSHLKAEGFTRRQQQNSLPQEQGYDPSLQTFPTVLTGGTWPGCVYFLVSFLSKVDPLHCTVHMMRKTSKKEVRTLKLLFSSLSVHMHFSILELEDLSVLICPSGLLICPRHLSRPQPCLPL